MPIVPVYRLRGPLTSSGARYRFSRDAHPNANPTPGQLNPAPGSWAVDRVAFYAWSSPIHAKAINRRLVPVYEFHRVDESGVSYRYSAGAKALDGWVSRDHVAFWMRPAETDAAGAPVYIYSQDTSEGPSYALSVSPGIEGTWTNESVLAAAAASVPVVVSVHSDAAHPRRFHWSYAPSTINLSYATTIEFLQAPRSAWRFVNFEIPDARENFETPVITDRRVLLKANYATTATDFTYKLTIEPFAGPDQVTSPANAPERVALEDHGSVTDRAVSDPEVVNQTPDRL